MMKSLKTLTTAVVLLVVTLFWTSCKKEIGKSNPQNPQEASIENKNLHTSGAVADDPARVERLSTIVSSDYLQNLQHPEQWHRHGHIDCWHGNRRLYLGHQGESSQG